MLRIKYIKQGLRAFYRIVFYDYTSWGICSWKRNEMNNYYFAGRRKKDDKR